ncbi:hypothetical protein [Antrihabitans spumae]|uniref:protein adenylyltransferase n=1 Tax=Antrihabitans spumae TaxID=3373370 RepID=A0ABW7K430_9NOCA
MPNPWDTGNLELNWQGYYIPGTTILRNRVDAQTPEALRDAENDLVEARVIELREAPELLGDRTYGLHYLRAIHRQLFQDMYVWAGDLRTVRRTGLDWQKTDLTELHSACHTVRAESDLAGLTVMFGRILDADPAYDF